MNALKTIQSKIFILSFLLILSCHRTDRSPQSSNLKMHKLESIKERGKLIAVTDYNSINYFIYRGQPMGYQFELLQELADHLGVRLEVRVSNNLSDIFESLEDGDVDLIAANLAVTKDRKKIMDFTVPQSQTRQVLVQRKPKNWEHMSKSSLDEKMIRNQLDLAGKTIYVQKNSAFATRLHHLSDEIGDSINIVEVNEDVEQLISYVASGDINYTISDENVARVNQTYYPNIDIGTAVSFPQNLAWAVRKGSDDLLNNINNWLTGFKKTAKFAVIYNKYFENQKSAQMVESDYYTLNSGKVSAFDNIIKKYSTEIHWDWRLLASLIYQESHFNPHVVSWAGAFGLMQLMPTTARRFGINMDSSPNDQIKAGVKFLKWLDSRFSDIKDENERIKFILAAYNVGYGHIVDARNLARKYGKDPDKWENNVDEYLLSKSDPKYYNDPVVKYGYCRGIETYHYVTDVLERYKHYKNIIKD